MKKIFIYYSLTGNGKLVADYLKDKNIEVVEVITREPLPKNRFLSIFIGGYKASINHKDRIESIDVDLDKYDEIIIGSPIWNSRLSCPIMGLLDKINLENRKLTFILYSGSGKEKNRASEMVIDRYKEVNIINLKEPLKNKDELNKLDVL